MKFALWAYPWDLLDENQQTLVERLQAMGINELNVATNYHSTQTFLPHNPKRRTFFTRASAYFQPGDGYGRLSPMPNEEMEDEDWLARISDRFEDAGIALNSWTIGTHNSRLGFRHSDVTITNAHGDNLIFGLCPSHPDVQEYLASLLEDLSNRDCFKRIELETFDFFHGRGFGWHHDKFHTRLGTLGEFLYGLCFCNHCRTAAREQGVDVDRAREVTRVTVDAIAEGAVPFDIDVTSWLSTHPTVSDYIDTRYDTLTSVFNRLKATVTGEQLGYYVGLLTVGQTWMHGADLRELTEYVDYYTVAAYESSATEARKCLQTAEQLTPDVPLHAGILPGHPAIHDGETVASIVEALVAEDVPRISFYNYGLLPERNLDWIANAIGQV